MNTSADIPRVCLLTETFYPVVGGGETHARLLARKLNSMQMPTFVMTRRTSKDLPWADVVDNIPVYRLPPAGTGRFGKYAMVPYVIRELFGRKDEYDLIFVCGFRVLGAPAVMAARRLGKPCVLRAESIGEMSGGYASVYNKLPPVIGPLFRRSVNIRNKLLRNANLFISISQPIAEEFGLMGIDKEHTARIANGLDTEIYRSADADDQSLLRRRLNLPLDKYIASYSGKLNQGKGLQCLLKAWEKVYAKRQDICLLLIGSGGGQTISCEAELRRFADDHGLQNSVIFTGYVKNVNEYLQASDIFVFPSENEAFGLSLIEAMACGLPSIASRTGGIPEIVQHGVNGILIEAKDHDSLADQIEILLDDPYYAKKLAEAGQKSVYERYSIDKVAARYYELFSQLHQQGIKD